MTKTVLITGTSTGIGREIVYRFHREGWNVIATMRSPEKEKEYQEMEGVFLCRLDTTDEDSIQQALAKGEETFGKIDVLVNNAGIGAHGLFENYSAHNSGDSLLNRSNFVQLSKLSPELQSPELQFLSIRPSNCR